MCTSVCYMSVCYMPGEGGGRGYAQRIVTLSSRLLV